MLNGIINIYKEEGYTSFDVVAVLRGILKIRKIGHTGTLDPLARGVLPVCLGNGTKLCDMLTDRTKTYEAVMLLGTSTDTEDTSGKVLETKEVNVSKEEVIEAVNSFVGDYDQVPPMYSALKVDGKKLYELARQGVVIERKPRRIHINSIEITDINLPYVTMNIDCSKGTYIRSLCRDIGDKLGCGGCMDKLTRTRVGGFEIKDAYTLAQVEEIAKAGHIEDILLSVEEAFDIYECLKVKKEYKVKIDNGNPLYLNCFEKKVKPEPDQIYRIHNTEDIFFALYRYDKEEDILMPYKIFPIN